MREIFKQGILSLHVYLVLFLTTPAFSQVATSSLQTLETKSAALTKPALDRPLPLDLVMTVDPSREVRVATGIIGRDQTIVSIPYLYRRTAVLTEDLIASRLVVFNYVPYVHLKAGAVGYWAGEFEVVPASNPAMSSGATPSQSRDSSVWCFFGVNTFNVPTHACIQSNEDSDAVLSMAGSRWYISDITYSETFPVSQFKFEERPLKIGDDLRLEYRFREWDTNDVDVLMYANGEQLFNRAAKRLFDGSAIYVTPAGEVKLTQVGKSRSEAQATLASTSVDPPPPPSLILKSSHYSPEDWATIIKHFDERIQEIESQISRLEKVQLPLLDVAIVGEDREDFFPIKWRDVVLRRTVRPGELFKQKASPLNRPDRFGVTGAILYRPLNEMGRRLLCLDSNDKIKQPVTVSIFKTHCLEDDDGDGKYEWLLKNPLFSRSNDFTISSLHSYSDLKRTGIIPVERAPLQDLPYVPVELIASGITQQIRSIDGQYRPSEYRFSFKMVDPAYIKFPYMNSLVIHNYNVALDRNGTGELRAVDGTLLIEVRNAKLDGSAEVRLHGLLKPGLGPIFDHATEINKAKKLLAAYKSLAASAREDRDVDLNPLYSEDYN
ncbi:hypothetical protein [Aquidulcibacter sp.]|uniref:hypothetical protein n=1 Tax=Aquidulcibacter sp. TaxID=2052990 RepID=UPI0025C2E08C|nr:hypothetical protein [Aquidulcibacter sp.]MCA3695599.1 hypothetical protein [Aquidulcibacter sp.]